jgi:hypothetical protein
MQPLHSYLPLRLLDKRAALVRFSTLIKDFKPLININLFLSN